MGLAFNRQQRLMAPTNIRSRLGLFMGVLGGYTTFSTLSQETLDLFEEGRVGTGTTYTLGSMTVGILGVLIGSRLGRVL